MMNKTEKCGAYIALAAATFGAIFVDGSRILWACCAVWIMYSLSLAHKLRKNG